LISLDKMPAWVRVAEIVLGLVSLVAGIWVIVYPGLGVLTLILLLSVGLIFLGWRDVLLGAMGRFLPGWLRAVNIALGILAFILSVIVIAEPGFAVLTLVLLLYVALFVRGVAGIALGAAGNQFSPRHRAASVVAGLLSIVLAVVFLALPGLLVATLILLLSIGLLVTGLEAIAAGVMGRKIVPVIASQIRP
jgi:uncharacterized membrane protein HdeD (DUF308 family)